MTLNHLVKTLLVLITSLCSFTGWTQQVNSFGIFTGLTVPYTFDEGINKDARYQIKYDVKFAPIGVHFGVDYDGYGFMLDPGVIRIGQNFNVINIQGGHVGERKINLTYFQVPFSLKLHIIDLSFFKVSFIASVGAGYMIKGEETISHRDSKLKFPLEVTGTYPSAENDAFEAANPGYTIEYDGVLVPSLSDLKLTSKDNYRAFQLFGGLGFRSDWDISEQWRVSFDLRGNIGFLEPRNDDHVKRVKNFEMIYDIYGARKDLYLSLNLGLSRTIEIDPKVKQKRVGIKHENKSRKPENMTAPNHKKLMSPNKKKKPKK